jgi:tRNA (guanine37-N1)-methyltransferase
MLRFDILTLFPPMFHGYLGESIIKRAIAAGRLDVRVHNLRDWSADPKHHKVDDRPFGGGPGMVMMVEPFYRALKALLPRRTKKTRVILMSAKGKLFTHADAVRLAAYDRVVLLCGHYEGVDERVVENLCDEELSIGEYVLTGGELPALVIMDAVARHVPGVLGKAESLSQESHTEEGMTEYPQYTRPEVFVPKRGTKWSVPEILLSGDHRKIEEWRRLGRKKTEK